MIRKHMILLTIYALFVSCNGGAKQEEREKTEPSRSESSLVQTNEFLASQIRNILIKIKDTPEPERSVVDTVLALFRRNEEREIEKGFPSQETDDELFYSALDSLLKKTSKSDVAIYALFHLDSIIERNAEWAEFLSELIHKAALTNVTGFLRCYKELTESQKKVIIEDLFWLKETENIENFYKQLDKISDDSLQNVINEISAALGNSAFLFNDNNPT